MRLQLVTWRDANFSLNDEGDPKDYLAKTVGWTKRKGRWLIVYSERLPHGDGYRAVSRIPVENVVKRKTLR